MYQINVYEIESAMSPENQLISICQREISDDTIQRATLHVLDWLGICLAARHTPQAAALERYAQIPTGHLVSAAMERAARDGAGAAFLLGGLGSVLEMDDLHNPSIMHAGNVIIPSALSCGLKAEADGRSVLAAIVRGYEAGLRIGTCAAEGGYRPVMNSVACGVFGSSMAASDVLALSGTTRRHAMAQAGMMASGLWQCRLEPGHAKQVANAHAARAGVEAAHLAVAGMTGPGAILSGPLGFLSAFYPDADPSTISRDVDSDWKLYEVSFKPYPACRHTHPAIDAALETADQMKAARLSIADIERISIQTYRAAIDFCDNAHPVTNHDARFSLQHTVAVALSSGAPKIDDFDQTRIRHGAVSSLRRIISVEENNGMTSAFPNELAASIRVELAGGPVEAHVNQALGEPANPMSTSDLIAKFHRNVAYAGIPEKHAEAMEAAVRDIGNKPNLRALTKTVAAALRTRGSTELAS